jgi:hypothetical protein
MTGAVAASLSLVVVLIVALDWPFRGRSASCSTPMSDVDVEHSWTLTASDKE